MVGVEGECYVFEDYGWSGFVGEFGFEWLLEVFEGMWCG